MIVNGAYDDMRIQDVRRLEQWSHTAPVQVCLWSDALVKEQTGAQPKFPQEERQYFLASLRFVQHVRIIETLAELTCAPAGEGLLPPASQAELVTPRKKVVVTGCYDWLHSGHIRFFEEVSLYGDLFVVVGNDENVRLLKGAGHPLFPQDERRYMVAAVRFVTQALITSGSGWMDAEPEINQIQPDYYAVNDDGDRPEKREFCRKHGIEYLVLKRAPKTGLPRRESTHLRGF